MLFRKHTLAVLATDLLLVAVAWQAAFWLRFNFEIPAEFQALALASVPLPLALFAGAEPVPGVRVEQIQPSAAVVRYRGQRYELGF